MREAIKYRPNKNTIGRQQEPSRVLRASLVSFLESVSDQFGGSFLIRLPHVLIASRPEGSDQALS